MMTIFKQDWTVFDDNFTGRCVHSTALLLVILRPGVLGVHSPRSACHVIHVYQDVNCFKEKRFRRMFWTLLPADEWSLS
jgi:hypothetical protein